MSTAIATPRPIDTLKVALAAPKMQSWLSKQIHSSLNRNATQMINIVLQAASASDALAKCTPSSILAGLCIAGQIGLVPNTALGHAYLIPFNNRRKQGNTWVTVTEAQLVIGYKGFVKLVFDAAEILVQAQPVYKGDEFDYDLASFPPVKYHRPGTGPRTDDLLINAWCHAQAKSGRVMGDVLTREQVERRRNVSKSYLDYEGKPSKNSPWVTNPAEMWRKSACRAVLRYVPTGNDERLERAVAADDGLRDNPAEVIDMSKDADDVAGELSGYDRASLDAQQSLPAANPEELSAWLAEFATCTDLRALDDVAVKAKRGAAPACQQELERAYLEHSERIRGRR